METYVGHSLPVYSVQWNLNHDKTFVSSSADWTIRLWDRDNSTSLMAFNLEYPVTDVKWSPYSATVFSAVTTKGEI